MKRWPRQIAGVMVAAGGILVSLAGVDAQTCSLELKRLKSADQSRGIDLAEYMFRTTYPQSFFMQTGQGRSVAQETDFSKIVKKEPAEYVSKNPFRGVAALGTEKYAFVLDVEAPKSDDKKSDSKEKEEAESKPSTSIIDRLMGGKSSEKSTTERYSRLYFDLNHNSDLTDDKVIEALPGRGSYGGGYSQSQFPRVDLTVDAGGTKLDYAFSFSIYSNSSGSYSYASASLSAAAYREGEITLEGKKRRVVLLDFNSNGRFDDEFAIRDDVNTPDGKVYPAYGDVLLIDPPATPTGYLNPYDVTCCDGREQVSKLINLEGRFYDLEVTPAGDQLALTPCSLPMGQITNPNDGFRALVYGDKGVVKIAGDKSKPVALPEGDWKLFAYTIDQSGYAKAEKKEEQQEAKPERSLLEALSEALMGSAASNARPIAGTRYTMVSAQATKDVEAVQVRQGKTVAMPFGPPYKPVVKVDYKQGDGTVSLGMSVVGSAGEICSNLLVDGGKPKGPEFTIRTAGGDEVESGKFEYG
jgi:hypothetical protein